MECSVGVGGVYFKRRWLKGGGWGRGQVQVGLSQVGSRSWDVTDEVNKVSATSVFRIRYLKRSWIIVAAGGLTPAHLTVITQRWWGGVYRRLDSTGVGGHFIGLFTRRLRSHVQPGGALRWLSGGWRDVVFMHRAGTQENNRAQSRIRFQWSSAIRVRIEMSEWQQADGQQRDGRRLGRVFGDFSSSRRAKLLAWNTAAKAHSEVNIQRNRNLTWFLKLELLFKLPFRYHLGFYIKNGSSPCRYLV